MISHDNLILCVISHDNLCFVTHNYMLFVITHDY